MIDEIQVKDVALIREASLSPSPGLTVLPGETGAGKTALTSAVFPAPVSPVRPVRPGDGEREATRIRAPSITWISSIKVPR